MIVALPTNISNLQLLFGSALVAISGAAIGWVKGIPQDVYYWLRRRLSVQVYVGNESPIYNPVYKYITSSINLRWIRKFSALWLNDEVKFSPGLGTQYFFYGRTLVEMTREVEKSTNSDSIWNEIARGMLIVKPESITLTFFTRDKSVPLRFMQDATTCLKRTENTLCKLYTPAGDEWHHRKDLTLRGPETVILPDGRMAQLVEDLEEFFQRKDWYARLAIPYRRGYLFYGTPGSGKSSTIAALCKQAKLDIYTMSLLSMNDDRLQTLVNGIPTRCALVLEDLDVLYTKDKNLSLSGLLNALDGLTYADGTVVFATTNHLNLLDPALIRRGRFDVHVEFTTVTTDQVERFMERFYGERPPQGVAEIIAAQSVSMADVQNACLENMHDPHAACDQILQQRITTHHKIIPARVGWTLAAMLVPVLVMFAQVQHRSKPAQRPASHPRVSVPVDPDPEEFWACGLGTHQDKLGHHCHCQEFVEEVHTEHMDHCKSLTDEKAYEACMNTLPEYCDVVKNADLKHPVHSCKRSCNKNAICKCPDGGACHLPPLPPVLDPETY